MIDELSELDPSFISVTYGALGGTRDLTRDLVIKVDPQHDFPTMPHLTCVGHTRADLVELLDPWKIQVVGDFTGPCATYWSPPAWPSGHEK